MNRSDNDAKMDIPRPHQGVVEPHGRFDQEPLSLSEFEIFIIEHWRKETEREGNRRGV